MFTLQILTIAYDYNYDSTSSDMLMKLKLDHLVFIALESNTVS